MPISKASVVLVPGVAIRTVSLLIRWFAYVADTSVCPLLWDVRIITFVGAGLSLCERLFWAGRAIRSRSSFLDGIRIVVLLGVFRLLGSRSPKTLKSSLT